MTDNLENREAVFYHIRIINMYRYDPKFSDK